MFHVRHSLLIPVLLFAGGATSRAQTFNPTNGHYYEIVTTPASWTDANTAASARIFNGANGYLGTITSQNELDFLTTAFGLPALNHLIIGGFQSDGQSAPDAGWQWVTGETWSYTNWNVGEPNDGGSGIELDRENRIVLNSDASWNDVPSFTPGFYLVEYTPAADTPEPGMLAMLGGLGVSGAAFAQRRRRARKA